MKILLLDLVKAGLKVVGCARRADKLEKISKTLTGETGKVYSFNRELCHSLVISQFYYRPCDLSVEEDIRTLFTWIENHPDLGRVDICVSNAGFSSADTLMEGDFASWRKMMDVNVLGKRQSNSTDIII